MNLHEITTQMNYLNEWNLASDSIVKEFKFDTFNRAINFVNSVAHIAEARHHHPDIMINFNKVRLSLTTHDDGGLSEKDFEVAKEIDKLISL